MVKIAIDAGHGLHTAGKRTPDGEREWSFNAIVAESAISHLKDYKDVSVIRLDDPAGNRDVPLRERTDKANAFKADALVSCHHNANTGKWGTWTGTETYSYPNSKSGLKLAQAIHPGQVKVYGLRDRGLKTKNLHMIRESKMPAILIEGGFMDSTIDIKKMRDKNVLKEAGKAIAEGLASHFNLQKKEVAPKPPTTNKPSGNLYKVQIGAFKNKDNADQLAFKAKARGFDQFIVIEDGLYKVQIGAYANKDNADAQVKKAKKAGFDVYVEGATTSTSESKSEPVPPKPKTFKVGDKVKIKSSAKNYTRTPKPVAIPPRVKNVTYTIDQVGTNDVLIKELVSWVRKVDVQ